MSKGTRAQSISSASSEGSSSSLEIEPVSASTSRLPASRNLSGIGYRPPRGFDPIEFSKSSVLNEKSLSNDKGREAWAFRVPSGISPSQLDGLVIQLPPQTFDSHDSSKPLASIQVPATTSTGSNTYNLYVSIPEANKRGKKEKKSSSESQLISMAAAGSLNPSNPNKSTGLDGSADAAAGQGAAAELASLHLFVPTGDGSQPGRMILSPVKISKCLHMSVVSPASAGIGSTKQEAVELNDAASKAKRQQPWELLTGSFQPAGARNDQPSALEGEVKKRKKDSSRSGKDHEEKSPKKVKKESV